ncbi:MAG: hypothetical protein LBD91_08450 [Prevotellaceae bacterium]|jgi:hypothetical protein|nr:hypothetical protein [Prevotellaceae bacterium]
MTNTIEKRVNKIAQTYYRQYRDYGNLIIGYDDRQIRRLVEAELIANGQTPNTVGLDTVIEGNIITGAYKLDTDDNVLIYLFFAAVIIWVIFYYRNKFKKE